MQSSSLLVSKLLHGEPSDLSGQAIGSWLINEMNTQKVARGVALDSVLVHHRDVWRIMQVRQRDLREDTSCSWVEPRDGQGRIIITGP